ncbi:ATP-binding protein [Aurantimicrobium minutum]|uniref:histidine kinase n=1 Tax=Aurantimicrobium minutum TaxID=708131 RepID=A0A173LY36_9MICO|nr:ATP-binding protein [Aurantimicrobium minutum]BAU99783.1 Uncharacterized protein AUMI_112410 [Aurantimicrobium minutum]
MIDFWRNLGRKEAINWIAVVLLLLIQLNGALLVDFDLNLSGKMPLFWLANALPFVPMALVLALGRFVIIPRFPLSVRPTMTLIIFEISIFLRLFTYDLLLQAFGITEASQFWARFGSAQANQLIVLVVIGYLVASAQDYARQNAELASLLAVTKSSQQEVQNRLLKRKQALIKNIETQLNSALNTVKETDSLQIAEQLKFVIDSVVRPLSHQLGRGQKSEPSTFEYVPKSRIDIRSLLVRSFTDNPFYPVLSVLWMFFPVMTTIASYGSRNTLLLSLLFSGLLLGALFIARLLWMLLVQKLVLPARVVCFTSVPLVLSVLIVWFFSLTAGINTLDKIGMLFLYFFAIVTTITLVGTSRRMLREKNSELKEANAEVKRELVNEQSEARSFEETVSRVLHGPIQDAIWASLRRIEQMGPASKLSSRDLEFVRQPITDALLLLREPVSETQNIEDSLQELIELWGGAVDITLSIPPSLSHEIECSPTTSRALAELLREAISNAIRHGDATEVVVELRSTADGQDIHVKVVNNGAPIPMTATPGLGTQLLDDLTLSWSRSNHKNSVILEAVVPLQNNTYLNQ